MKIPALFYDTKKNVKKNVNQIVKQLKKGLSIVEAIEGCDWIDTDEREDLIFIEDGMLPVNCEGYCHLYLLVDSILYKLAHSLAKENIFEPVRRYYDEFFTSDWLSLLLLNSGCEVWLRGDSREKEKKYIERIIEIWNLVLTLPISFGGYNKDNVWKSCHMLRLILSTTCDNSNIPDEAFLSPLPNNNLQAFVDEYKLLD